jgi:PAS domain S-box-containing protein
MKITTKILITTLPLVVLGLLGLGWMTTSFSERALDQLAEKWLNTKLLEAVKIAEKNVALLARYDLQDAPANVKKAQDAAAEAMGSIQIGQSGCILVLNASGAIVFSSDRCKVGMDVSSESWFKTIEDQKKGHGELIYKGAKYLTVQQYFEPWQWYVLACARQHEVYGEVDYMKSYVFAATGLSAAVITLFLVFLIHRITAPLNTLVRKVKRIGQGDLEVNVSIASRDEIGILADTFNSTAVQLSELISSLEQQIAERKRAEKKLIEYHEQLEDLVRERTLELENAKNKAQQYLDIAGVILVAIDADRRVTLINQEGCGVLGRAAGDIIGKDWFKTFVPENNRQGIIEDFQRLMAGEPELVKYIESPVLMQNGRKRLIAWHHVILRNNEGNIIGTLSSGKDITKKKRAEKHIMRLNQDLQQRAAALEAANQELEGFTYSVSHDLRAPLRHIDGFIKLLQERAKSAIDERSRHYMDNISEAAQKMGRLIDGLLSFARMGRHAMSLQPVDLGSLVRDVIRELEPDTDRRNIDWCIGDLPMVSGDAAMLRIVLVNLISNALKYTRCRQQARIEIGSQPGRNSDAVMFVRDNGAGFDMAYADKLFGVFQRLHHADEFEGTGGECASYCGPTRRPYMGRGRTESGCDVLLYAATRIASGGRWV